jgi:hypothetical protein
MHSVRANCRRGGPTAGLAALLLFSGPMELLAQQPPAQQAQIAVPGDAYADEVARELVRLARIRRSMVDRRIEAYETRVVERMSAGLGLGIGERLLYRRETVSNVSWTPDTVRIDVLAARDVLPSFHPDVQVPVGLAGAMPSVAFDPVDSEMLLRFDNSSLRHPLATGSEAHYRYAAGDSTVIRLPDGRSVRLRELRITPRRQAAELIAGSFWLDMETHAVVQAYFRLARPLDTRRGDMGADAVAGALLPMRAELEYIAIDYGLWDLRWWLPRTVAAQGVFHAGPARIPVRFERRYDNYTIQGAAIDFATLPELPGEIPPRPCRPRIFMSIATAMGQVDTASRYYRGGVDTLETTRRRTAAERREERDGTVAVDTASAGCERVFIVNRPSAPELLQSDLLPHDIYDGASPVFGTAELEDMVERLRRIPDPSWRPGLPRLGLGLSDGMIRYNRVEGLSLGVRSEWDLGRSIIDAEVRLATASREVGAELGATRSWARIEARPAAYRRLDVTDISQTPFLLGRTLNALVLGRDENDYFRATGAELTLRPQAVRPQWWDLRIFTERQQPTGTATDFHLRRIADGARTFRPNIDADTADQAGATLRLRAAGTGSARSPRWAMELELHGEAGDFDFARPTISFRTAIPLGVRFTAGFDAAAGSTFGTAPVQRAWYLGGPATLRGHDFGVLAGSSFWNARAELGTGPPAYRFIVFGDLGWAGDAGDFTTSRPLRAAGLGFSLLDGVLRLDLARAVATRDWRLHLRLDGIL